MIKQSPSNGPASPAPPRLKSRAARRYLALWFPLLPAERLSCGGNAPADSPFALVEKARGRPRLVALDARAQALGLEPDMLLSEAQALVPDLIALDHDPVADHLLLEQLADGCDRYTPLVMIDPPGGLTLDITVCDHPSDSEEALADDVVARLATFGLQVRYALAGTPEAAQALARFQTMPAADEQGAIRRLGVAALRLDDDTARALRDTGLRTIGDLAGQSTGALAATFGEAVTDALARLIGKSDTRIGARRTDPALMVERRLAEPIARTEHALAILAELTATATGQMAESGLGGRRFVARFFRSDGIAVDLAVGTSLPLCDPDIVKRLFDDRLATRAAPLDPGCGFDLIRLSVPAIALLAPTELLLEGGAMTDCGRAALANRRGAGRSRRPSARDTQPPQQATLALPAVETPISTIAPAPEIRAPAPRPVHLVDPPRAIDQIVSASPRRTAVPVPLAPFNGRGVAGPAARADRVRRLA